jgi:ABC-type branched-subunit amino acid transport system permease subunit
MSFLTPEQKNTFGGAINVFGSVLAAAVMVALACKFILSGYPPIIAWMEPLNELVIIIGAVFLGLVIANNNKLVK